MVSHTYESNTAKSIDKCIIKVHLLSMITFYYWHILIYAVILIYKTLIIFPFLCQNVLQRKVLKTHISKIYKNLLCKQSVSNGNEQTKSVPETMMCSELAHQLSAFVAVVSFHLRHPMCIKIKLTLFT